MSYTKLASRPSWPTTFTGIAFDTGLSTDPSWTSWPISTLCGPIPTKWLYPTKPRIPPRLWNTCCSSTSCTWHWTWGYGILIPPYSTYLDFKPVSWTSSWPFSTTTIWTRNSSSFLPETYSDHTIKSIELWNTLYFWKNTNGQNPKPTSGPTLETWRRALWHPEAQWIDSTSNYQSLQLESTERHWRLWSSHCPFEQAPLPGKREFLATKTGCRKRSICGNNGGSQPSGFCEWNIITTPHPWHWPWQTGTAQSSPRWPCIGEKRSYPKPGKTDWRPTSKMVPVHPSRYQFPTQNCWTWSKIGSTSSGSKPIPGQCCWHSSSRNSNTSTWRPTCSISSTISSCSSFPRTKTCSLWPCPTVGQPRKQQHMAGKQHDRISQWHQVQIVV